MKAPTPSELEITSILQNLVVALESGDKDAMQNLLARDVVIHLRDLDLHGRASFFELYSPMTVSLGKMTVKASGDVGWGYGSVMLNRSIMRYCVVLQRRQNLQWKIVLLHISDICL